MTIFLFLVALLLLGPALAAQSRPASTPAAPVDPDRMTAHVKVLASDEFEGRAPATAGETKTVDYIAKQFQALGLQPGGAPTDVAGAPGRRTFRWRNPTPARSPPASRPAERTARCGRATTSPFAQRICPSARVTVNAAPLVFVGFGVSAPERKWDDFKGIDLRGKIALVLINDPDFETDLGAGSTARR